MRYKCTGFPYSGLAQKITFIHCDWDFQSTFTDGFCVLWLVGYIYHHNNFIITAVNQANHYLGFEDQI